MPVHKRFSTRYRLAARVIFASMSALGATLAPLVEFGFVQAPLPKISIYLVLVLGILGTSGPIIYKNLPGKAKRRRTNTIIRRVLDMACISIAQGRHYEFRLCVFCLPKYNAKNIEIKYHSTNMIDAPDVGIKLEKWQGCTGYVWGSQVAMVADLTAPPQERGPRWGLNESQSRMTEHLAAVLSIPIRNPEDRTQVLGILSFDTEEPVADYLDQKNVQNIANKTAGQIGELLVSLDDVVALN